VTAEVEDIKEEYLGTQDVVEGALEGGATEVVVNDCHYAGFDIDSEELRPEAELIRGQPEL